MHVVSTMLIFAFLQLVMTVNNIVGRVGSGPHQASGELCNLYGYEEARRGDVLPQAAGSPPVIFRAPSHRPASRGPGHLQPRSAIVFIDASMVGVERRARG